MNKQIFIVGLPASGKTTASKQLAKKLGCLFVDLDKLVEQEAGLAIPQLFETLGEDKFREIEALVLREFTNKNKSFVMACGGGTPCFNANMDFMNDSGLTIYLYQPVFQIAERLKAGKSSRPLVSNVANEGLENYVNNLLSKRESFYIHAQLVVNHTTQLIEKINSLQSV